MSNGESGRSAAKRVQFAEAFVAKNMPSSLRINAQRQAKNNPIGKKNGLRRSIPRPIEADTNRIFIHQTKPTLAFVFRAAYKRTAKKTKE